MNPDAEAAVITIAALVVLILLSGYIGWELHAHRVKVRRIRRARRIRQRRFIRLRAWRLLRRPVTLPAGHPEGWSAAITDESDVAVLMRLQGETWPLGDYTRRAVRPTNHLNERRP